MLPHEGKKRKAAVKGQESQHLVTETRVPAKPWQGQAGAALVPAGAVLSGTGTSGRRFSDAVPPSSHLILHDKHQLPERADPAPHRHAAGSAPCGLQGMCVHSTPFAINDCTTLPVRMAVHCYRGDFH